MRTGTSSRHLLAEFAQHRSDEVFRTIVSRHIDLMHSTALRRVNGDSQLAQDVCQEVFALLASKAKRLAKIESVEGWLYRQTCRRAANAVRSEQRRRRRENSAMQLEAMNANQNSDSIWTQLAPELETAMLKIPAKDRQAVLLRYFEGLEHSKMAEEIGATAEAARKRVARALEKLRVQLARQGVAIPAAALSAALLENAVAPAPAHAAAAIVLPPVPVVQSAIVLFMKSFLAGACVTGCAVFVAQSIWSDLRARPTLLVSSSAPTTSTSASTPPDVPSNSPMRALPDNPSLEWLIREMRLTLAGPQHALAKLKRSQLTEAIPRDQMQAFIELAEQSLTIEEQAALLPTVFAQWNKYAPASVFAFLLKSDIDTGINKINSSNLLNNLFDDWARSDLNAARQWLVNHWSDPKLEMGAFDGTLGRFLAKKIATELSDHHGYPEALQFALSLPGFEDRLAAAGSLVGIDKWHSPVGQQEQEEWLQLLGSLQEIEEQPLREPLLEYFWKCWGYENFPNAREALISLDVLERIQAEMILWTIPGVRGNPVDAGMGVTTVETEEIDDQLSQLERVLDEAEESGVDRKLMEMAIGERLIASSSIGETTVGWIEKHWPKSDTDRYFVEQAQREMVGRAQFSKALSHAERIQDPDLGRAVISGIIRKYGAASPLGVAQYLDSRNDWDPDLVRHLQTMLTE